MRNRLIRSTLLVVVLAVLTLGIPLLVLARHQVWASANERLKQQATTLASEFEDSLSAGRRADLSNVAGQLPDERVIVRDAGGGLQSAGAKLAGKVRRQSVHVGSATVTVEVEAGPTIARARRVTLEVIGLALIAAIVAVALAVRQARNLAAPLAGLAEHADALGSGDFAPSSQVSGIPEIDAIAHELDRSAQRIGELVAVQQQFASDAAHQLRTPLTGIGLRLEEIIQVGDAASRAEAEAALAQVERLDGVVTALLARARGDAQDPVLFEIADLVRDETAVWGRVLRQHKRNLRLHLDAGAVVHARRDHVRQVLSALLDNALSHGRGDVTVTVQRTGETVTTTVADEGAGVSDGLQERVFERSVSGKHGTGIGLALARALAEGEGGTLRISPQAPAALVLTLRAATQ
ncbi:MAG: HAMP domain-containing protein [Frankiaceae bacterium]|nr:HAMP domain-containing protein [Frankiaceae bacterium]MBV9870826.1 HAMP domain-containing protein [Frankiaceae bacterium]